MVHILRTKSTTDTYMFGLKHPLTGKMVEYLSLAGPFESIQKDVHTRYGCWEHCQKP